MPFNSYHFIFFFLPIVILSLFFVQVYFKIKGLPILIIVFFSLFFYAYDSYKFLFILLFSIFINYLVSLKIDNVKKKNIKKLNLFFIIIFNFLILVYFKYYNFFIENLSVFFSKKNINYI